MGPIDGSELGGAAHRDGADGVAAAVVPVALAVLWSARADERQGGTEVGALSVLLARKIVAWGNFLAQLLPVPF
jgi:hypothetical protein